ncbi:MAG: hypothetical protein ACREX3_04180 [Gammaproteobacteria bacterium]
MPTAWSPTPLRFSVFLGVAARPAVSSETCLTKELISLFVGRVRRDLLQGSQRQRAGRVYAFAVIDKTIDRGEAWDNLNPIVILAREDFGRVCVRENAEVRNEWLESAFAAISRAPVRATPILAKCAEWIRLPASRAALLWFLHSCS